MENNPNNQPAYQEPPNTDGYAIASLVLGIVSFVLPYGIGIITGILAIVFSNTANKNISAAQGKLTGLGMSKAGLVCGIVAIALHLVLVAACGSLLGILSSF